jgi:Uncharacterized alpha/beta hydrolase domain (DUF2235)
MAKNIVVFSDGTGQDGGVRPEQRVSNIYKMYRASRVSFDSGIDPVAQVTMYDPGLGTDIGATALSASAVFSRSSFRPWRAGVLRPTSRNVIDLSSTIISLAIESSFSALAGVLTPFEVLRTFFDYAAFRRRRRMVLSFASEPRRERLRKKLL